MTYLQDLLVVVNGGKRRRERSGDRERERERER